VTKKDVHSEACARIEANDLPIKNIDVLWEDLPGGHWGQEPLLSIELDDNCNYYDSTLTDVDAWRRFGRAIQVTNLERFCFDYFNLLDDGITPAAAACLETLFSQSSAQYR
jgi:hypothetical protein